MVERLNKPVPGHLQPAAKIIPHRDAQLVAGLGETQKRIATIAADIAARPRTDLAPRDITTDVIFRSVGVQRRFWPVPSVPMKLRHPPPGSLDLRARKDHHAHAHGSPTD